MVEVIGLLVRVEEEKTNKKNKFLKSNQVNEWRKLN